MLFGHAAPNLRTHFAAAGFVIEQSGDRFGQDTRHISHSASASRETQSAAVQTKEDSKARVLFITSREQNSDNPYGAGKSFCAPLCKGGSSTSLVSGLSFDPFSF
jgi:hypothetical protein